MITGILRALAIVAGTSVLLVAASLAESAFFFPVTTRTVDVGLGQRVFQRQCASCHTLEEGRNSYGPCLYNVGDWAGSRRPGMAADAYIIESIVKPGVFRAPGVSGDMPENIAQDLSDKELLSVAAFLCSQGGKVNYGRLLKLLGDRTADRPTEKLVLDVASIERGREIFLSERALCTRCHSLDPYPGNDLLAPSLLEVGRHRRDYLEDKLLHPNKQILADYKVWKVIAGGVAYEGRRLPAPENEVKLLFEDAGNIVVRTFQKTELTPFEDDEVVHESANSPMPSCELVLSEADRKALVDFLCTLR